MSERKGIQRRPVKGGSDGSCGCVRCFYCELPLAARHEHDHFPIPHSAGGEQVVPACLNCHSLKDRKMWAEWPTGDAWKAWQEMGTLGRILVGQLLAFRCQLEAESPSSVPSGLSTTKGTS